MTAISKNKKIETEQLIGLPSEICGFKDGFFYPPKSFKNFGEQSNQCYNGLFYLLGDFQNSKDFKFYKTRHKPLETLSNPLILQIYVSLIGLLSELRKHPRTVFSKKSEYSLPYKGKINFTKTIIRNNGLLHKTYKTVNEMHIRSLERRFLSSALKKLPVLIGQFIPKESKKNFYKLLSECSYHLQELDEDNTELNLLSDQIIHKPNKAGESEGLLSYCKILAEFMINNSFHGVSDKIADPKVKYNIEYNDFHLNLNRPFEKLLRRICEKLPRSPIGDEKFSEIHSVSGNIKHLLIPDVYSIINISEQDGKTIPRMLILDAKHKEFVNLEADFSEVDPFIQYNRIDRNDLHQLITYIRTNLVNNDQGIFGFFGFIQETLSSIGNANYEASFIDYNKDHDGKPNPLSLKISNVHGDDPIFINILGLRFGSVLSFIGKSCEMSQKFPTMLDDLYCRLAIELASSLYEDQVVTKNKTLDRTLNSCLEGASRSLFFVYEGHEKSLEKIGYHVVQKYLKLNTKLEVINSGLRFIANGKALEHSEIRISSNNILYVIDSEEDPNKMFDEHRVAELFDFDFVTIITRNGLSVFQDGVGVNASTLLDASS